MFPVERPGKISNWDFKELLPEHKITYPNRLAYYYDECFKIFRHSCFIFKYIADGAEQKNLQIHIFLDHNKVTLNNVNVPVDFMYDIKKQEKLKYMQ